MPSYRSPLDKVLKHLSFAKQRFDSISDPQAKLALLLLLVGAMLALQASDERNSKDLRDRCVARLKKLSTKFCIALGLSADWGQVCALVLHVFDSSKHDIAYTRAEIDWLIKILELLFIEGHVWTKVDKLETGVGKTIGGHLATAAPLPYRIKKQVDRCAVEDPIFLTEQVLKQIQRKCVFRAGGFPVHCWSGDVQTELDELSGRIANVAKVTIERIHAEFPEEEMRSWLQCYDIDKMRIAFDTETPAEMMEIKQQMRARLFHGIRCVAKALKFDNALAEKEYHHIAKYLIKAASGGTAASGATAAGNQNSTKIGFYEMMKPDGPKKVLDKIHNATIRSVQVLPDTIAFYLSIEDGECNVERDLACVRSLAQVFHFNSPIELMEDTLLIRSSHYQEIDVVNECGGMMCLTDLSRAWATLWREIYGALRVL